MHFLGGEAAGGAGVWDLLVVDADASVASAALSCLQASSVGLFAWLHGCADFFVGVGTDDCSERRAQSVVLFLDVLEECARQRRRTPLSKDKQEDFGCGVVTVFPREKRKKNTREFT